MIPGFGTQARRNLIGLGPFHSVSRGLKIEIVLDIGIDNALQG